MTVNIKSKVSIFHTSRPDCSAASCETLLSLCLQHVFLVYAHRHVYRWNNRINICAFLILLQIDMAIVFEEGKTDGHGRII